MTFDVEVRPWWTRAMVTGLFLPGVGVLMRFLFVYAQFLSSEHPSPRRGDPSGSFAAEASDLTGGRSRRVSAEAFPYIGPGLGPPSAPLCQTPGEISMVG